MHHLIKTITQSWSKEGGYRHFLSVTSDVNLALDTVKISYPCLIQQTYSAIIIYEELSSSELSF
jgi:hypothetical protein